MKFDWENWNIGGWIIFISFCLGFLSLFMNWMEVAFMHETGFALCGYYFLICWLYPLFVLLKDKKINLIGGIISAIISIIIMIGYIIANVNDVEMYRNIFGEMAVINSPAAGAWLFLFASILLFIGVLTYAPTFEKKADTNFSESTKTDYISITQAIEELSILKEKGILTEEEYKSKKEALLKKLS